MAKQIRNKNLVLVLTIEARYEINDGSELSDIAEALEKLRKQGGAAIIDIAVSDDPFVQ